MKLQLNKKKLKNLSKDSAILPSDLTPKVVGGGETGSCGCATVGAECGTGQCSIPPITVDGPCGATGSCGCISDTGSGCQTNTCLYS